MSAEESQVVDSTTLTSLSDYTFTGNNFTVERKCKFIHALREHGSIFHAAQATNVSRRAVYDWINADEQFAQAVTDIREDNYDDLETSVYKRAFKSDLLAMFYLKAHRPKFRDKLQIDLNAINEEIEELEAKRNQRQLPPMTTEFIDTDYSREANQYQVVGDVSQQIPHHSDEHQKEECFTGNIPTSE